jgi:dihydrolipoamide dehydrogenase
VTLTVKTAKGETKTIEAERVLSAIGRAPNVEDLGLEKAGVKLTDRGFIQVDRQMRTSAEGIYAIGDVAGPPLLAHKGSHEGIACVEAIHGDRTRASTTQHPQLHLLPPRGRVGGADGGAGARRGATTSRSASSRGRQRPGADRGRDGRLREGDPRQEVLGGARRAHRRPARHGADRGVRVGRHLETTVEEMDRAMHPHPTLSEAVAEAALAGAGAHPLHI